MSERNSEINSPRAFVRRSSVPIGNRASVRGRLVASGRTNRVDDRRFASLITETREVIGERVS